MKKSKKEKILDYLKTGEVITPKVAYEKFGAMRLASIVHKLKLDGYQFSTKEVKVKDRDGHVCRIAEYRLVNYGQGSLF